MYYLYKKSKSVALPKFAYTFKKFEDFYALADVLTYSLYDAYYIRIKSDSYKEIYEFMQNADSYSNLTIYIETSDTIIDYISLRSPDVSLLTDKSNYETFCDLISEYGILFAKGCIRILYFAIEHDYVSMREALELLESTYPDAVEITEKEISSLFVVDNLVYPRTVCIMYLRLDRGRASNLKKCVEHFGNDLVLYSIRKNVKTFFEEKLKYMRTGKGSGLIKTIPTDNIVRLYYAMNCGRGKFKDITTILKLYEEGVTINDIIQERTVSVADAKRNASG